MQNEDLRPGWGKTNGPLPVLLVHSKPFNRVTTEWHEHLGATSQLRKYRASDDARPSVAGFITTFAHAKHRHAYCGFLSLISLKRRQALNKHSAKYEKRHKETLANKGAKPLEKTQ